MEKSQHTWIEDILELAEIKECFIQIEAKDKSCSKETLVLNLKNTISDVNEINHIRSLQIHLGYEPTQRATQSDLLIMLMTR